MGHEGPAEVHEDPEEEEGHDEEEAVHDEAALEAVEADAVARGVAAHVGGEGRVVVEGCASSCYFVILLPPVLDAFSGCPQGCENLTRLVSLYNSKGVT